MTRTTQRFLSLVVALASATALPNVRAESQISTGSASPITATASLDFEVVAPKVLYLRVGAGTEYATVGTVNLIAFDVAASQLGNGTPVAATATSGDLGGGAVTARVLGNNGDVTLSATTTGALSNGAGDTVNYNQVTTTAAVLTTPSPLPALALSNAATTTTTVPATNRVVSRDARWTFAYSNSALVASGVYGGVNANNSRVTYTVSMP